MTVQVFKSFLRGVGLYHVARACYRRIEPARRASRRQTNRFFGQFISPGDLCFDIGANVGQCSEAMLAHGAVVVAVEPNALCKPAMDWEFSRNPRFTLVSKAVGAEPGSATLNFSGTEPMASLRDDWFAKNPQSQTVEVTTLDALIAEFGRPKFCKVDVEGFEVEVFEGLSQPIPIIYFEVHRAELDRTRQVFSRLASLGEITSANATDRDHNGWLFERFLPFDEFLAQFEQRLPGTSNIVLKMACP